jgi:hypothetical protein
MPAGKNILTAIALSACIATPVHADPSGSDDEKWTYSLAPFLWAMNINGSSTIGPVTAPLELDFKDDLLDNLDSALMLHFEANKGPLALFAEYQYSKLKPGTELPNGATVNVDYKNILGELGAGYTIDGLNSEATLQVIGGARYYKQTLDAAIASGPTLVEVDESWWDVFLGARVLMPLSDKWSLIIRGDGATGGSNATWHASGLFDWRFTNWGSLLLGYRFMNIDYENDKQGRERYAYNADQQGPILGINFHW